MSRPKIRLTVVDRLGPKGCHRGHKVGDSFDFDTERGQVCPMAVSYTHLDVYKRQGCTYEY